MYSTLYNVFLAILWSLAGYILGIRLSFSLFRIFEQYMRCDSPNTCGGHLKLGMYIQWIVVHNSIYLPWQYSRSFDQSRALFRFWGGGGGEHVHSKTTSEAIDMRFFGVCLYDHRALIPSWGQVFGWPHQYVATHWWKQKPGQGDILPTLLSGQKMFWACIILYRWMIQSFTKFPSLILFLQPEYYFDLSLFSLF